MHQLLSQKTFRSGLILALGICLVGVALYFTGAFAGNDLVLPVQTVPTYIKTPLFLEYFQIEGQSFGANIDQVLAWQHFETGSRYQSLGWLTPTLLWSFLAILIIISVTLTYLDRFLYLFCTGLMLFALMQLNLDSLGILTSSMNYIVLLLFGGTTYFFQSIKPHYSLFTRTIVISVVYLGFAVTIGQAAAVPIITTHVVAYGLYVPLILGAIFMVFVGADNVYSLFRITTHNAPNGKNGLIHFMSSGLVYIIVLLLLFLNKVGIIQVELFLIDAYLIFAVALVSGYYSLSAKLAIIDTGLPLVLIKQWLYPAMAGLSLILIGYAEISGNDSLSEALQLSILATQLGGAVVFYLYSFINFTPSLLLNEPVSHTFFRGQSAPLLTARILHILAIVGIFLYLEKGPYYQVRAARYTALGDMALQLDNDVLAKEYLKQASFNDYYNGKANYALAMLNKKENNNSEVIERLTNAGYRDDRHKTRLALANYFSENNELFKKLITLQETQNKNDYILNNQAIAHFEFQQYDSTFLTLNQMKGHLHIATANIRALDYYTMNDPALGLPETDLNSDNLPLLINAQATANRLQLPFGEARPLAQDTILVQEELFLLFNQSLNFNNPDYEDILGAIDYYLSSDRNSALKDFLLLGRALRYYREGEVNRAFLDLNQLSVLYPAQRGLYTYLMALWAARQGAPADARLYLKDAASRKYDPTAISVLSQALDADAVPVISHDTAWDSTELDGKSGPARTELLKELAIKNPFNVPLTLKAIAALESEGLPASDLYELLRQGVTINRHNLELTRGFAAQAIEAGVGNYGRTALEDLAPYSDPKLLAEALKEFDQHQQEWLNRPLE